MIIVNQIISAMESSIEEREKQAEKLCEDKNQILEREIGIRNSIQKLENDIAVSRVLEKNLSDIENKKEDVSRKIEEFGNEMNNILNQIEDAEADTEDSESAISELESIGEDVGDSKEITLERRKILEKCREQIGQMLGKLGNAVTGRSDSERKDFKTDNSIQAGRTEQRSDVQEQKGEKGKQNIETFNKMIDESVKKHKEMSERTHYLPEEEKRKEHAAYAENAEKVKKEFAAQSRKCHSERNIENGYVSIKADEIKDFNIRDKSFWSYKSTSKEKYLDMAAKIPEVKHGLQNGKSIHELRQNPKLKDTIDAYFDEKNMIIVEKDSKGYHFQDNGRHRVAATREMGVDVPVKIIERPE